MGRSHKGPPTRRRSYVTPTEVEKANRREFHLTAYRQRECASCGEVDKAPWQSHHVVEKRKLKAIGRMDLPWDTRNARRVHDDCHEDHTNASNRIALSALTDENYEFAWFVLGTESADYLRAKYKGQDPRWDGLMAQCMEVVEAARASA